MKSMKSWNNLIILALAVIKVFIQKANAEETSGPVALTLSTVVANKYLNFSTGSILSDDPAIQTDLLFSFKGGIYLDIWNSRSLKGSWNDESLGNEFDYGIGWKGLIASNLTLNVGVSYFDTPEVFTLGKGDLVYTHVTVTKECKYIDVVVGFDNYTAMPESGFNGGNLFSVGVTKTFSLYNKIIVSGSILGVYDTGTIDSERGVFLRGNTSFSLNITHRFTLNLISLNYYIRKKSDVVITTGLTMSF